MKNNTLFYFVEVHKVFYHKNKLLLFFFHFLATHVFGVFHLTRTLFFNITFQCRCFWVSAYDVKQQPATAIFWHLRNPFRNCSCQQWAAALTTLESAAGHYDRARRCHYVLCTRPLSRAPPPLVPITYHGQGAWLTFQISTLQMKYMITTSTKIEDAV